MKISSTFLVTLTLIVSQAVSAVNVRGVVQDNNNISGQENRALKGKKEDKGMMGKSSKDGKKKGKKGKKGEMLIEIEEEGLTDQIIYLSGNEDEPSIGDHYIWSNPATDQYGNPLTVQGSCHRLSLDWFNFDCTYQYLFGDDDKIFAAGGLGDEGQQIQNGITGGTGAYNGASGTVMLYFPTDNNIAGLWKHEIYLSGMTTPPPLVDDLDDDNCIPKEFPICPKIYLPVCSADGITYPNACLAQGKCAEIECNGMCPCTPCVQEPARCLTIYNPVCGADGKTYSNDCVARAACAEIFCRGECPCKFIFPEPPIIPMP